MMDAEQINLQHSCKMDMIRKFFFEVRREQSSNRHHHRADDTNAGVGSCDFKKVRQQFFKFQNVLFQLCWHSEFMATSCPR